MPNFSQCCIVSFHKIQQFSLRMLIFSQKSSYFLSEKNNTFMNTPSSGSRHETATNIFGIFLKWSPFPFVIVFFLATMYNGILLPKLFWPTVRKNCSFEIRGWRPRICKIFEITRTICLSVKGQQNSLTCSWRFFQI